MDSHSFVNQAFQAIAAFLIFVTGFVALFVLVLACVAVVCFLYWATNRLAVLLTHLRQREAIPSSTDPIALPAPAPRSAATRGLSQAI